MSKQIESALTAPEDRDLTNKWRPQLGVPELSNSETELALEELNITNFVSKFPRVDRTYADPPIPLQNYSLFSFIPAKGAKPNEKGIFGFGKIRGNFNTQEESNMQAELIIRRYDSCNKIFHCYTGRPFPITVSSNFSAEHNEIDIRKEMTSCISENIKQKKYDEEQEIREIQKREEELKKDVSEDKEVDPYDEYITLKVKKAQLSWTYLEHIKKMNEIKEIIIKSRKKLEELDQQNSEFAKLYLAKYNKARENAGIDTSDPSNNDNFMKFMVEDAILPGIDSILNINP